MKGKDLAAALGISASYLSELEKGRKTPNLETIEKYAIHFAVPTSSILWMAENLDAALAGQKPVLTASPKLEALLYFASLQT